jgi:hypothetical protein
VVKAQTTHPRQKLFCRAEVKYKWLEGALNALLSAFPHKAAQIIALREKPVNNPQQLHP